MMDCFIRDEGVLSTPQWWDPAQFPRGRGLVLGPPFAYFLDPLLCQRKLKIPKSWSMTFDDLTEKEAESFFGVISVAIRQLANTFVLPFSES